MHHSEILKEMAHPDTTSSLGSEFDEIEGLFYSIVKKQKTPKSGFISEREPPSKPGPEQPTLPEEAITGLGSQIMKFLSPGGLRGVKIFKLDLNQQISNRISYEGQQKVHLVTEELQRKIEDEYRSADRRRQEAFARAQHYKGQEGNLLFPEIATDSKPDQGSEELGDGRSIQQKLNSIFSDDEDDGPPSQPQIDKDGFAIPLPRRGSDLLTTRKSGQGHFLGKNDAYEELFPFAGAEIEQIQQNEEFEAKVKESFESVEAKEEDEKYAARKRELYKPKKNGGGMNRKMRRELEQVEKLMKETPTPQAGKKFKF